MAVQKQDDQHEHTFSSYERIRDVVLKTYLGRWTIRRSGERGSGISLLPARYDEDDDKTNYRYFSHVAGFIFLLLETDVIYAKIGRLKRRQLVSRCNFRSNSLKIKKVTHITT